jgi:hypothetical protein
MRPDRTGGVFSTKLSIIVHNFPHQLFDQLPSDNAVLLARQFCDCLGDRVDNFVRFSGIDFVRACCRRIFGEEIDRSVRPSCSEGRGALGLLAFPALRPIPVIPMPLEHPNVVQRPPWAAGTLDEPTSLSMCQACDMDARLRDDTA